MNGTYPKFTADCSSLLCRYLTPQIFTELSEKVTANGYTFLQAINSGVVNQDSGVGVYAGDAESYSLFAPLFDPIICAYHGLDTGSNHPRDLSASHFEISNPDPTAKYILSTRIRVGRNLAEMPLGPALSSSQRLKIESCVAHALTNLSDELKGCYYPLAGMSDQVRDQLIADHFLFKTGDRFLDAAGLNRDWPDGRGIYHNDAKTFLVWVNEEDQLRIISMQPGGDINAVFTRLISAIKQLEKTLTFSFDDRLGYLTSCPTNLGTALRASVHIHLPKLGNNMSLFNEITTKHHLQIRGVDGEHSVSDSGIFDVSNKRRLGVTEVECINDLYGGVVELIQREEELS